MLTEWHDYLFCCLTEQQKNTLATSEIVDTEWICQAQAHLIREKHGYRCSRCGTFHPSVQLLYEGQAEDIRQYAMLPAKAIKCKKAADIFCGNHYYGKHGDALLKFELDSAYSAQQTDSIPIRRDTCYFIASPDEKYIATETFSGTIVVIDTQTKLLVARRQRTTIRGACIFTPDHKLLYYFKDAIRCWDFLAGQDTVVFRIPELWQRSMKPGDTFTVVCSGIIYQRSEDAYLFVCATRMKTYVVTIRDMKFAQVVQLPRKPGAVKLFFSEGTNQYTFSDGHEVIIYDAEFRITERFAPPHIMELQGGPNGPIFCFKSPLANENACISPDGKWLLLDYRKAILLMRREDRKIVFFLPLSFGVPSVHYGFLDNAHFWYINRDTTYIQPFET